MFSPEKILQEVVYLLSLNDNKMSVLKLMKELYLADRASIKERDTSISGDIFVSMPHGPVLSQTLNLLSTIPYNAWKENLEQENAEYFYDVKLKKATPLDRLSKKDKQYLFDVSEQFKNYKPFDLEDFTHKLPEWVDPKGSSRKIKLHSIMKALGKTDEEIAAAKTEYELLEALSDLEP